MLRIPKTEARRRFSEVITRAGYRGERVKITHYGKTLAIIVPKADLRIIEDCERKLQPRKFRTGTPNKVRGSSARPRGARRGVQNSRGG